MTYIILFLILLIVLLFFFAFKKKIFEAKMKEGIVTSSSPQVTKQQLTNLKKTCDAEKFNPFATGYPACDR